MGCARLGVLVLVLGTACGDGGGGGTSDDDSVGVESTAGASELDVEETAQPARDFTELDEIIDDYAEIRGLDGIGFVVVDVDDGIVHEHYAGQFTPEHVSFVASSSKMVSAGVLMRLHDDGLLDLDAPVAAAVGWGAANPDITPAQLVSNSSGLVGLARAMTYAPYVCQWSADSTLQQCGEQIFTTAGDDDEVIPPDTEFRYGGGQWQVAGAVAEAVSGRSWAELIQEIYVEPCGLRSVGFANPYARLGEIGFIYPADGLEDPDALTWTENPNIEAGMFISPVDYAQLLLMHLREGRCGEHQVLQPSSVERLHADRIATAYDGSAAPGVGYGMGWWIDRRTGRISDAGAFGAVPWLDLADGYGAYLVVEEGDAIGRGLAARLYDPLDAIMASGD